jgi:hypothetical protein
MATLLQLVQQAAGELGLVTPTYIVGNNSQDTIQQFALLNAVGYELQRQYDWQAMTVEYRTYSEFVSTTGTVTAGSTNISNIGSTVSNLGNQINNTYSVIGTGINQDTYVSTLAAPGPGVGQVSTTQASTVTAAGRALNFCKTKYPLPVGYDRQIDSTSWDKTKHWSMIGPETAQQWQWLKSGFIASGPRIRYRLTGGYLQIWPPIASAEYLGFEYVSNQWVLDSFGVRKGSFTLDTDTSIFPDRLLVLGLKLKYFEIKGFDTASLRRDYQMQLDIAKSNDSGSQTLSLNPGLSQALIGWDQIPDSGYGV